jgi:hypothetical protein
VSFYGNIKKKISAYVFEKRSRGLVRSRKVTDFETARSIAVIYHFHDETSFRNIQALLKSFLERRRTILSLGITGEKKVPPYCLLTDTSFFVTRKDLNWYGVPRQKAIQAFMEKESDILIDLCTGDDFAHRYIAGLSHARLRAGIDGENHTLYYDVLIKHPADGTLDDFIGNVLHYLRILKEK